MNIEPQKVYASPNELMADGEDKAMVTLANLVDRELVATIGWAKQVPGRCSLEKIVIGISSWFCECSNHISQLLRALISIVFKLYL